MFIDSHCHLQFFDFATLGIDEGILIAEAKKQQVEHLLCVATHLNQHRQLQALCHKYQEISMSIGLHPNENIELEPTVADFLQLLDDPRIVAIGETGLDYYRLTADPIVQQDRFRTQIRAALASNKPLIIHTRDAQDDTMQILKEENASKVGGVVHCFTGDQAFAQQAITLNFHLSFSGIVTFAKAQDIQAVAKWVPLDRILIETDAPYLAPVPFRGKTNQPAYVRYVAEYIAKLRKLDLEEFANITKQNYYNVFG